MLATPAAAQVDTLRIDPPADTLRIELPADTARALPDDVLLQNGFEVAPDTVEVDLFGIIAPQRPSLPVLVPPRRLAGNAVTGVPARQAVFASPDLFRQVPGAFIYSLGVPGAPEGVALGLSRPDRVTVRLDDQPAEDIFTGRPAIERLPADLITPIHAAPMIYGAPVGLDSELRAFVAAVPVTELRYRAGPDGHQYVSATHAQTRRPPFVQRLGGEQARLSWLVHVGGHSADGEYTNARVSGWNLAARAQMMLPGLFLSVTQRHHRREAGGWGGVDSEAPDFFLTTAPVLHPLGDRTVIQNDLSIRASTNVIPRADPLSATLYWTAATLRHETAQTTRSNADRFGVLMAQGLAAGGHRLLAEVDLRAGRIMGGEALPAGSIPLEVHATVRDSIRFEAGYVVLSAGYHVSDDWSFPSGRVEAGLAAGPAMIRAAVFAGGSRLAPAELFGFGTALIAAPHATEQNLGGQAAIGVPLGPVTFSGSVEWRREMNPRLLVLESDRTGAFVSLDGAIDRALGTVGLAFRPSSTRGIYADLWVSAALTLNRDESELHRREADALPEVWGHGRLGFRALGVFDNALDADVYLRGRAWSTFNGRAVHTATGLMGLAPPDAPAVPGRGTVDVVLEAGLGGGRARLFLTYDNVLAGLAYPGAFVVPIYPLPQPALRIGVFWVLAN